MPTLSTQFEAELKKLIDVEVNRIRDILDEGSQAVKDYADYKFLAGQLFAYHRIMDSYFPETNDKLSAMR